MTSTISTVVKLLPTKALPPRERLLELTKTSCRIFSTTYNPLAQRTGNRVLRERLRGPALLDYYPQRKVRFSDLRRCFPQMGFVDEDERQRLLDVQAKKARGKGAPKKKKGAASADKKGKRGGGGAKGGGAGGAGGAGRGGEEYVRARL